MWRPKSITQWRNGCFEYLFYLVLAATISVIERDSHTFAFNNLQENLMQLPPYKYILEAHGCSSDCFLFSIVYFFISCFFLFNCLSNSIWCKFFFIYGSSTHLAYPLKLWIMDTDTTHEYDNTDTVRRQFIKCTIHRIMIQLYGCLYIIHIKTHSIGMSYIKSKIQNKTSIVWLGYINIKNWKEI